MNPNLEVKLETISEDMKSESSLVTDSAIDWLGENTPSSLLKISLVGVTTFLSLL